MNLNPFKRAIAKNINLAKKYHKELNSIKAMHIQGFMSAYQAGETNLHSRNHRLEARMILAYPRKLDYFTINVSFEGRVVLEFKRYGEEKGYTVIDEDGLLKLIRAMRTA